MGEEKSLKPATMAEETEQQETPPDSKDCRANNKTREVRQPFPCKVYGMLEDAEEKGFADVVSWNNEGNGFTVHNKERFTKEIVPKYFNQTRYKSFQRQLSLYGFERATVGNIKGLRYHENLRRGCSQLCRQMKPVGYKPRGQEKLRDVQGADTRTNSVSPPMGKSASQELEVTKPMHGLPTVISSESMYQRSAPSTPPLVSTPTDATPNDGFIMPPSVRPCSHITERLVSTDSIAVFEGMPFFLMTTLPPETQHNIQVPTALPPPIPLVGETGGPDGQMKKAWDIGFAVALTMAPSDSVALPHPGADAIGKYTPQE